MVDIQKFIADSYLAIGIPYHHQGRNEFGLDCVGLIVFLLNKQGISPKDSADYSRYPRKNSLIEGIENSGLFHPVPINERRPGDILVFIIRDDPQHLGILVNPQDDSEMMIHSAADLDVRSASLGEAWIKRITKVFRCNM